MLKRVLKLLTLTALVNVIYQHWPRGESGQYIPARNAQGKWGFIDEGGRVRVEFAWDDVGLFHGGNIAGVMKDRIYGGINRRGEVVIPVEYREMINFWDPSEDLAKVRRGPWFGWVDREGREVVPAGWVIAGEFNDDGVARVGIGIRPNPFDGRVLDTWGLVDSKGGQILAAEWQDLHEFGFHDVTTVRDREGWKLIDRNETVLADFSSVYQTVDAFGRNGLARVVETDIVESPFVSSVEAREGKTGWIDTTGKLVIPLEWDGGGHFDDAGMALVKRDDMWGWIDEKGEVILPLKWRSAGSFDQNGQAQVMVDGKWGMIDREGNFIMEPFWTSIQEVAGSDYLRVVDEDGQIGLIDRTGATTDTFITLFRRYKFDLPPSLSHC